MKAERQKPSAPVRVTVPHRKRFLLPVRGNTANCSRAGLFNLLLCRRSLLSACFSGNIPEGNKPENHPRDRSSRGGELTRRCRKRFFRGEAERRRTLLRRHIMKKKLLRFAALMIALAFVFTGTACRGGDVVVDIGHDTPAPTAKPTTSPTAEPTPEPTVEPTPEPTPAPVHATLMFVGDLMCLSSQQRGETAGGRQRL